MGLTVWIKSVKYFLYKRISNARVIAILKANKSMIVPLCIFRSIKMVAYNALQHYTIHGCFHEVSVMSIKKKFLKQDMNGQYNNILFCGVLYFVRDMILSRERRTKIFSKDILQERAYFLSFNSCEDHLL